MQNNNFIFEILSKFLFYIFDVNHFVFLIFFGYLVFRIISFLCKKFGFSKQCVKSCLNKIKRKNKNIDKCSKYFDYAPIDLIDEYKSQEESKNLNDDNSTPYAEQFKELKSFLENDNVKNLAVFGSYGAGKSSFIKTFFNHFTVNNRREDDEVIYISLSDFDYINVSKKKNQSNKQQSESGNKTNLKLNKKSITIGKQSNYTKEDTLESNLDSKSETFEFDTCKLDLETVETEIIRQLVCSKISKKIPVSLFSNFKSDLLEKLKIAFVIFCCISVILLCLNQHVEPEDFLSIDIYLLPKLSLLFILIYFFIKYIFRRFRFSNISFFNIGVSAKDKSELSVFDAYLDEITYLFEESNCRYVVFEDLDRTDNYEVLTHLRSLNYILNNDHRCKDNVTGKQSKIVFIYVIRSDIFNTAQEAVKFFDASVHVQNVITSANSWEFFIKFRDDLCKRFNRDKLKNEFLSKKTLTDEFLSNIAFFVTDLRLVKMIFNDYLNILSRLDSLVAELQKSTIVTLANKLFSYATFRSSYTKEYEELLNNKGIIFDKLNKEIYYWKEEEDLEHQETPDKIKTKNYCSVFKDQNIDDKSYVQRLLEYLSDKPLLSLLLNKKYNYLSADYRLYNSFFLKAKGLNTAEDIKFFSEILNLSNSFEPNLVISQNLAEFVLQYFPNTVFICKRVFNYSFFNFLLKRIILTNDIKYKNQLQTYVLCLIDKIINYSYISSKQKDLNSVEALEFIEGLCDFFCHNSKEKSVFSTEKICLWLLTISDNVSNLFSNQKISEYVLSAIKSSKFIAYILQYGSIIFNNEYENELFDKFNKTLIYKWTYKELVLLESDHSLQTFLASNPYFVTHELFSSLLLLNFHFTTIDSNLSINYDSNLNFIIFLINQYLLDKNLNVVFYFIPNWYNFNQIAIYLRDKFATKNSNSNNSRIQHDDNIGIKRINPNTEYNYLTTLFTITDKSIRNFDTAFFRYLFKTLHYENLLYSIGYSFDLPTEPYLKDDEEIIFFVVLMMCLSYVQNRSEYSIEHFASRLSKSNNILKSNLERYSELSLFDNVLCCFLDAESRKLNEIAPLIKKTIAYNYMAPHVDLTKDNIFSKWMNIYPAFNFNNGLNLYKAFAKAFSVLLDYSCLEPQKHAIDASITNIIYIRNILDRRLTDDYPRVYPDMSSINEYKLCWKSLSQFFHKYYKEIFASDKDKLYNLAPGFDKSPYSFEKTKQYISSLKKKDN